MNNPVVYDYKGNQISFMNSNSVMINATQMAKSFDKRPIDYLRLPSTNELINAIVRKSHISENQLVISKQGSAENGGGTWLHEDIALDFAQWLSIDFRLWCNDRIKELLTTGVATVANDDEAILRAMQVLQERVDASRQRVQILEGENEYKQHQIEVLAPKANYTDKVLQSTSTYTMTQVAKEFGMSAHKFGEKLKSMGIMFYQSGTWLLTAKYQNTGYTKSRTHTYTTSDGRQGTNTITVWTEIGRAFLHAKLDQLVA